MVSAVKNIVLIGFMGTGKTSAGKILASRIGFSFIDTDVKIESERQMMIREIFAKYGEAYFRRVETEAIKRVARARRAVISTGGGAVLNPENMEALARGGAIVSLKASVDAILERTAQKDNRPLLAQADRARAVVDLLAERAELYEKADLVIDTTRLTPMQVADEIARWMRRDVGLHA